MNIIQRFASKAAAWMFPRWSTGVISDGSGVRAESVSGELSLQIPAVLACVRVISQAMASMPLQLHRKTDSGSEQATDHPLYARLAMQPNSEHTSFEFRQTMQMHACLWGNAYAWIDIGSAENVIALWPIHPARVRPERLNGERAYRVWADGGEKVFPAREIMHLRWMSLDGLVGISPIAFTRRTLEQAAASEKYALSFYSSGGRPRNILTSDAVLKKEKKEELIEAWRGMVEAGTAIIDGGLKYQEVSLPFDDAKYLGSRKFSVADVGRIFGVPLHMIGDLERSTNNNIEHQGIEFWQNTIMPWTVCWEQAITRDLIGPRERATIYPKHNMSAIMRGSYLQRQQGLAIQRQNGVLTGNEWRRLEELNDIVGGDELLINGNMIPAARARGKANHG